MNLKGDKKKTGNLAGRPILYEEVKLNKLISLSPKALEILDKRAEAMGLTRSEVIERLARGLISRPAKIDFSSEELELIKKAVRLQLAFLEDEIASRGLFGDQQLQKRDQSTLNKQIETLKVLLGKVEEQIQNFQKKSVELY